ncbi:MAG: hypothetical protein JXR82_15300 [Marinifilaceae bacterium]|nr:hypothetical protein [Marinifilaceae bacterium]
MIKYQYLITIYSPIVAYYILTVVASTPVIAGYNPTVADYIPTVAGYITTVADYIPMVETYRSAATMVNHQQNYAKIFLLDSSHPLE